MKNILLILFLFCAFSAQAIDRITATISFTNAPANNDTLTVNGNVRTWKTTVVTPSSQIAVTNSAATSATNYFAHITEFLYGGPLVVSYANATNIQLTANSGNALAASVSGTYAVVTLTTQAVTQAGPWNLPANSEPTAWVRTNKASQALTAINDYATNAFSEGNIALSNYLSLTSTQVVSGGKLFSGANTYSNATQVFSGGSGTNITFTNCVAGFSNGVAVDLILTNPIAYGSIYLEGVRIDISQDGIQFFDIGAGEYTLSLTNGLVKVESGGGFTIAAGTPELNKVLMADASGNAAWSYIPGLTNATLVGSTFHGTNILDGNISLTSFVNSTLVNGNNNALNISTNGYVIISGPTAAFAIVGIAGGRSGQTLLVECASGYDITIANNSGLDVAGNRIRTKTGADVTVTGAGIITLRFHYNGTLTAWIYDGSN